jgi:hypothetical protein
MQSFEQNKSFGENLFLKFSKFCPSFQCKNSKNASSLRSIEQGREAGATTINLTTLSLTASSIMSSIATLSMTA